MDGRIALLAQRDLEDQIKEEYENLKQKKMSTTTKKEIKISEVIKLIKEEGFHRLEKDDTDEAGSIQAKYGLSFIECKELFAHPLLKRIKRKVPSLVIIDDVTISAAPSVATPTPVIVNTVSEFDNLFN